MSNAARALAFSTDWRVLAAIASLVCVVMRAIAKVMTARMVTATSSSMSVKPAE
jgi:hypothetical protein